MKKIVSLLLVFVLVFSISTTAFAADGLSTAGDTVFSYYNDDGEIVTIAITRTDTTAISKVYINGVLSQKAIANSLYVALSISVLFCLLVLKWVKFRIKNSPEPFRGL